MDHTASVLYASGRGPCAFRQGAQVVAAIALNRQGEDGGSVNRRYQRVLNWWLEAAPRVERWALSVER